MNASKTLIAAMAAATIVGTVGFVSAQTTDPATPAAQSTEPMTSPSTTTPQMQQPAPESPAAPGNMSSPTYVVPSTEATPPAANPAAVDPSTMSEPAPKADRN